MGQSGFSAGFDPGHGWNGVGQLLLVVGSHPRYDDGDILVARNRRLIRYAHAQHICSVKDAGFNGDGLRPSGTLFELMQAKQHLYKFDRISSSEVRRTNLDTLEEDTISATPNAAGEYMHVQTFIDRRKNQARHSLFGSTGSEYWYGKRRKEVSPPQTTLDVIWTEIEARTAHRETSYVNWPFSERELTGFLALSVNDFSDADQVDLESQLVDESNPENPIIVKRRKNWIDWRELRDVVEADVLNGSLPVDIRGLRKHVRQEIKQTKNLP